jgi:hypothetical protein
MVLAAWLPGARALGAERPLETAIVDDQSFVSSDAPEAFARVRDAGASRTVIYVLWSSVAPKQRAGLANAADPDDPGYDWRAIDRQVALSHAAGLEPILEVFDAPRWATKGTHVNERPDPAAFGQFATAIARRYDGSRNDLGRVRLWSVWNEPNVEFYIRPQGTAQKIPSASIYRALVNSFADAVKAVRTDNVVVAGNTAPFAATSPFRPGALLFMREVLARPTRFDVWATHPYTTGGPTHHAFDSTSASLGDLQRMHRALQSAQRAHHIKTQGQVRLWVTEFGWDSKPPDPGGVPTPLHARWTAEALYRSWRAGVTMFAWFLLRDRPAGPAWGATPQSGLWMRGDTFATDKPKRSLRAFRFPFVAFPRGHRRVYVWGRAPAATSVVVTIRQGARSIGTMRSDRHGIFAGTVHRHGDRAPFAVVPSGDHSVPFGLGQTPDLRVNPFGGPLYNG